MQRKLLALAVAGAFAVPGAALAQVTISGAVRYSVDNVDHDNGSAASAAGSGVSKWGLTGHSANIKFQSRESLGGGLTAWGVLENGFTVGRTNAQNYAWAGRNSGLGLDSTSWGTVMMGLWDSPYKSLDGVWAIGQPAAYSYSPTAPIFGNGDTTGSMPNPNCSVNESGAGWTISPAAGGGGAGVTSTVCAFSAGSKTSFQRRLNSTVQWWSPVWSGAQVLLAVQTNGQKANSTTGNAGGTISRADPELWAAGLRWTGRNWGFILGYESHKNFNLSSEFSATGTLLPVSSQSRSSKDDAWKIGGNYNFGPVQVSLAYEQLKYDLGTNAAPTNMKHKNWAVGMAIPVGNGAIRGSWAEGQVSGSAVAAGTSQDGSMYNLSYEYSLSKRTLLYAAWAKLNQDNASNRNFGTNVEGPNGWQQANIAGGDVRYISFGMNHNF